MAEPEYPILKELETKLKLQWIDTDDYMATQRAIIQVEPELAYLELPRGRKGDKGEPGPAISIQGIITADSQLPASAEVGHAYVNTSTKGLAVWNGSGWFKVDNFAGVDADVQQFSLWLAQLESEARRAANAASSAEDSASSAEYWANETIQQVTGDFATRNYVNSAIGGTTRFVSYTDDRFANQIVRLDADGKFHITTAGITGLNDPVNKQYVDNAILESSGRQTSWWN